MALRPHDDDLLLAIDRDAVGGWKRILLRAGRLDAVNKEHRQRRNPSAATIRRKSRRDGQSTTHHPMLGSATPPRVVRNQRARLAIAGQAQHAPRAVVA
jgi:hypothetical protein